MFVFGQTQVTISWNFEYLGRVESHPFQICIWGNPKTGTHVKLDIISTKLLAPKPIWAIPMVLISVETEKTLSNPIDLPTFQATPDAQIRY